jgi:hypothetical protein
VPPRRRLSGENPERPPDTGLLRNSRRAQESCARADHPEPTDAAQCDKTLLTDRCGQVHIGGIDTAATRDDRPASTATAPPMPHAGAGGSTTSEANSAHPLGTRSLDRRRLPVSDQ